MYDQEKMIELHDQHRAAKEHAWYVHGERDCNPRVMLVFRGIEKPAVVDSDEIGRTMEKGWRIADVINNVFDVMPDSLKEALEEVWLGMDSYVQTSDDPQRVTEGSMKDDFSKNPASTVREQLVTIVATDDLCGGCDIAQTMQEYTISDGAQMVWGEIQHEGFVKGPVADALKRGFRKEKL